MRVSIWRITSAPDDTLVAHHITSFNMRPTGFCIEMDLRGDYFARYARVDSANGRYPNYIDIYDWRRSSSLVHHKATIVIGQEAIVSSLFKLAIALSLPLAASHSYSPRTTSPCI